MRPSLPAWAIVGFGLIGQIQPKAILPIIERHRIGPVEIGMSERQLVDAFPSDRRQLVGLQLEGMPAPAYLLEVAGATQRGGIVAELISGRGGRTVWRIQVRDPAFRTVAGIGIGSTVSDLRAVYHLDNMAQGEGQVAVVVAALAASFFLDQTGPGGGELWKLRTPTLVPGTVKIDGILLRR
jgi:hypothetical protein